MKNRFVLCGLALVTVLASTAVYAATAKDAPEKITLDDCKSKKAAVEFPHKAHIDAKLECKTCHHNQESLTATSTEEVKTCGSCHITPEKAETPVCSEMGLKKNPFHITCINCHKEELAKKPDFKGPTKCDQCHPKA
jgi:hypothetical protein